MVQCARHTREPRSCRVRHCAVPGCVAHTQPQLPGVSRTLCKLAACKQQARALTLQKESGEPKTQQRTRLLGAHGEPSPRLEDFKVLVHLIHVRVLLRAQAQDRLSLGRECDLARLEMRVVR